MLGSCVRATTLIEEEEDRDQEPKPQRRAKKPRIKVAAKSLLKGAATNEHFDTTNVVIYGNNTELFDADDEPEPEPPEVPDDPGASEKRITSVVTQSMIDKAVFGKRVSDYLQLEARLDQNPDTGAARTRLVSILTYHSENTLTQEDVDDVDNDGSEDIVGTGKWVGIARLILSPLTLGFDLVKANKERTFSSEIPFVVKVLGVTFGSVQIPFTSDDPVVVGPYTDGSTGLVCNVAYIPPSEINCNNRVQDAGDSFLVVYKGKQDGKDVYFCGTGLTTRTKEGYDTNQMEPLYEAGLCEYNSMSNPSAAINMIVPSAKSSITLDSVTVAKKTVDDIPKNTYTVQGITTELRVTGQQAAQFQEKQTKSASDVGVSVPCWGAVQIQIPRAAVKGILAQGVKTASGVAARLGILNVNLELMVCTAVE